MDIPSGQDQELCRNYQAFGLRIRSCLPLPELLPTTESEFDVEVKYASVPSDLPGAEDVGLRYQSARGRLLVSVDRIARFLVLNGDTVLINRGKAGEEDAIRLFLLGPIFNGLLQQREDLVLRGSAIGVGGRGMAFLGPSGAGKSTLAIAFKQRGYSFLTDELCVVRPGAGAPRMIQPGFPCAKLWPDSLKKLGLSKESFDPVRRSLQKRALPIKEGFAGEPLPIGKAYLLRSIPTDGIKLTRLESSAAYAILQNRAHLSPLLKGLGMEATYLQLAMTLAMATPFTIVDRPRKKSQLNELLDLLEADFTK